MRQWQNALRKGNHLVDDEVPDDDILLPRDLEPDARKDGLGAHTDYCSVTGWTITHMSEKPGKST